MGLGLLCTLSISVQMRMMRLKKINVVEFVFMGGTKRENHRLILE